MMMQSMLALSIPLGQDGAVGDNLGSVGLEPLKDAAALIEGLLLLICCYLDWHLTIRQGEKEPH